MADENFTDETELTEKIIAANQDFTWESLNEENSSNEKFESQKSAEFKIAPIPELDDFELLEMNSSRDDQNDKTDNYFGKSFETNGVTIPEKLSPEAIEIIADRVVEKLSDEVIRRIAREVVAQMNEKS